MTEADPLVENWYRHLDKGQLFQVVAFDEEAGLVEIQHFDGDLEEIDLDAWYRLDIEPADEPENWTGSMDIAETDDLGTEITDTQPEEWTEPLDEQPQDRESATEKTAEEEEDDWDEGYPEEEPLEHEPAAEQPMLPEEEKPEEEGPGESDSIALTHGGG